MSLRRLEQEDQVVRPHLPGEVKASLDCKRNHPSHKAKTNVGVVIFIPVDNKGFLGFCCW